MDRMNVRVQSEGEIVKTNRVQSTGCSSKHRLSVVSKSCQRNNEEEKRDWMATRKGTWIRHECGTYVLLD